MTIHKEFFFFNLIVVENCKGLVSSNVTWIQEEAPHLSNDFDFTFRNKQEANFYKWCPFTVCSLLFFGIHVETVDIYGKRSVSLFLYEMENSGK